MSDLVTIVVPVYGAEKDLGKLIESVLAQTYTNIELILVDDESPDRCGEICDEYAASDNRIKVIHKKNGGQSMARNVGIEASHGDYYCFVDDDDILDKQYVEKMYNALQQTNAGLCMCGYRNMRMDEAHQLSGKVVGIKSDRYTISKNRKREFYQYMTMIEESYFTLNKMFRGSVIQNNNITFPLGMKLGEDEIFVDEYITYIQDAVIIPEPLYIYADSSTSICKTVTSSSFTDTDNKMIGHLNRLLEKVSDKEHKKTLSLRTFWYAVDVVFGNRQFHENKDIRVQKSIIRSKFFPYMLEIRIPFKYKVICLLKLFAPKLYIKMLGTYHKPKRNRE